MTNEITQNLPKLINESYERANKLADSAKAHAEGAITEAQHCGRLLNKANESVPHGQWLAWLEANCPAIGQATAYRYMKLAKLSHVINFENCTSITNAYRLAEILPEPATPKPGEPHMPQPEYMAAINKLNQCFNKVDPKKLEPEDRQRIGNQIQTTIDNLTKIRLVLIGVQ